MRPAFKRTVSGLTKLIKSIFVDPSTADPTPTSSAVPNFACIGKHACLRKFSDWCRQAHFQRHLHYIQVPKVMMTMCDFPSCWRSCWPPSERGECHLIPKIPACKRSVLVTRQGHWSQTSLILIQADPCIPRECSVGMCCPARTVE